MMDHLNSSIQEQLNQINDMIHDNYIDPSCINYNPNTHEISIPIWRSSSSGFLSNFFARSPNPSQEPALILHLQKVVNHHIRDTEKIGFYGVNILEYDPISKRVWINTDVPMEIWFSVEEFEVSCEPFTQEKV